MQENADQPPSLSQLLRASYVAETQAQHRHSETSRSDASPSRLQIYGSLKGKGEEAVGHNDAQNPDLSAFLSQEELHESVNLARQAIGHETGEQRGDVKVSVTPVTASNSDAVICLSSTTVSISTPSAVLVSNHLPASFAAPSTTTSTSDSKTHSGQDDTMRNKVDAPEGFNHTSSPAKSTAFGPETQSKKEFLNKAADFIEELSSLFKANSSKRVRPRACKAHRSRVQNKSQTDETTCPIGSDNRERTIMPVDLEQETPSQTAADQLATHHPATYQSAVHQSAAHQFTAQQSVAQQSETHHPATYQPTTHQDSGAGLLMFPDSDVPKEEESDCVSQETDDLAESLTATESPHQTELGCEPPHFLLKLKSREVPEGTKVQLDCTVWGHPIPEVRWFCEGKELENSPDIQIVTNGELHSLVIAEAFEEDTGRYSCYASNVYGTDSTSAEIYVEGASSSDSESEQHFEHITQLQQKPLSSHQTKPAKEENSAAALTVEPREERSSDVSQAAPEAPPPVQTSATILQVPELLRVSLAPPAEAEEPRVLPVQVFATSTEPTEAPWGIHVLSALHLETSAATSAALALNTAESSILSASPETTGPQSPTLSQHNPEEIKRRPVMAAPMFTKSLQDLSASPGQLVVLECRVRGVPLPRVDWYREGKAIDDSPEFRILQKKEICTLVIAECFPEDSGMFTCTAGNTYGTVSSTAALQVKANGSSSGLHVRPFTVNCQHDVKVSGGIKAHASTVRLEPLVSSTFRLDPPVLNQDNKVSVQQDLHRSTGAAGDLHNPGQLFSSWRPFSVSPVAVNTSEQEVSGPSDGIIHGAASQTPPNGGASVVPLPDPPPNSCLKTGTLTNHRDARSGARVGLRVHFKLPEVEEDERGDSEDDPGAGPFGKEPPPVLAKPKLDPAQLQLLHHQVLLEQQQENEPQAKSHPPPRPLPPLHFQLPPEVESPAEASLWSPRMHREPPTPSFPSHQFRPGAPSLSSTRPPAPSFSSPPALSTPPWVPPPVPPLSTPQLGTSSPPVGLTNTIHASHLNLAPAAPRLGSVPAGAASAALQATSPAPQLRSAHASLMNLTAVSFNYARPKEFISAQTLSPIRSPSPTESPVPLLQELAAELNSSVASSPVPPPFSPPFSPTRVLMSPTSPPSLLSSPTPGQGSLLRAHSPPQASSPTSSSSSPSPIQNPVAFLSSVLPSLTPSQPTNSMGLPKGAPSGVKKTPKTRLPSAKSVRQSKELLVRDIGKTIRLKDEGPQFAHQQKPSNKGKTTSRLLGPNNAATVINYDEEYKISNFEQRLMSEIEFRLERTPVEESDDEVQHDDVPSGKCIAPLFDRKLKSYKAVEGMPVTFVCKILGVPPPKVYWFKDGRQILKKNVGYQKMREGDGTCSLHIESTTGDDDGNYTVMAANPQGRISCSGHLIVQSGPPRSQLTRIQSQRVRARVQEVEGEQTQERFFQPRFLQAPRDVMAHEGGVCRLDCKVSGLPNPELMWLVKGRPVYPDLTRRMLVRENGVHSLVIDPLTQKDAGTYTCIASNKAGQSSFSVELTVVEKEMKHPPQFVEKLQNMGVPEGAPVRLECCVAGKPPPAIFWKKDNETVSKTKSRISMTQYTTGQVCLLIHPTTKEDAGWYTVSAKNDAGVVSCTCRLDIYAQWHQSIPMPMRKAPRASGRYAALTGQGLDIRSAFSVSDGGPILFASSPAEATLESEEL